MPIDILHILLAKYAFCFNQRFPKSCPAFRKGAQLHPARCRQGDLRKGKKGTDYTQESNDKKTIKHDVKPPNSDGTQTKLRGMFRDET